MAPHCGAAFSRVYGGSKAENSSRQRAEIASNDELARRGGKKGSAVRNMHGAEERNLISGIPAADSNKCLAKASGKRVHISGRQPAGTPAASLRRVFLSISLLVVLFPFAFGTASATPANPLGETAVRASHPLLDTTITFGPDTAAIRGISERREMMVTFRVAKSEVDTGFAYNATSLKQMLEVFREVEEDSLQTLVGVTFCGTASLEGPSRTNRMLSRKRMLALESYIRARVSIPDSIITYNDGYIPWDWLGEKVEESGMRYKDEVLAVIRDSSLASNYASDMNSDPRTQRLQTIHDGIPWTEMDIRWLEDMRSACTIVLSFRQLPPPPFQNLS